MPDSGSSFTQLTAIKVRALHNVAVGSENQLHVLDNTLEGEEGRNQSLLAQKASRQHLLEKLSLLLLQGTRVRCTL